MPIQRVPTTLPAYSPIAIEVYPGCEQQPGETAPENQEDSTTSKKEESLSKVRRIISERKITPDDVVDLDRALRRAYGQYEREEYRRANLGDFKFSIKSEKEALQALEHYARLRGYRDWNEYTLINHVHLDHKVERDERRIPMRRFPDRSLTKILASEGLIFNRRVEGAFGWKFGIRARATKHHQVGKIESAGDTVKDILRHGIVPVPNYALIQLKGLWIGALLDEAEKMLEPRLEDFKKSLKQAQVDLNLPGFSWSSPGYDTYDAWRRSAWRGVDGVEYKLWEAIRNDINPVFEPDFEEVMAICKNMKPKVCNETLNFFGAPGHSDPDGIERLVAGDNMEDELARLVAYNIDNNLFRL